MRCSGGGGGHGWQLLYWLVLACSWVAAVHAQAQKAARTDPVEGMYHTELIYIHAHAARYVFLDLRVAYMHASFSLSNFVSCVQH